VANIQIVKTEKEVNKSPANTAIAPFAPNSLEKLAAPGLPVPNSVISFL